MIDKLKSKFGSNPDREEQLDKQTFEVETPVKASDGTHIPAGSVIHGYLRAERNEPDVSRWWVVDYYSRNGEYPAVQFDEREYVLFNADFFGKSDDYLVFATGIEKPEGEN